MDELKQCIKCLQYKKKTLEFFHFSDMHKDKINNKCKECVNKEVREWRDNNPIKYKQSKIKSDKQYSRSLKGITSHKRARLKWIEKNPDKNLICKRKWNRNNKDKINEYYQKTKDKQIQKILERRRLDYRIRLRHSVSNLVTRRLKLRSLGKNVQSIIEFLPWTIDELVRHLESKFQPGMTWQNYGFYGWHIDHIKPDCSFNYEDEYDGEFLECWSLKNLQPLWAHDNHVKGDRI